MKLATITDRLGYFIVEDTAEFLGQLSHDPEFEPHEGPMTPSDTLGQRVRRQKGEVQVREDWKKLRLKKIIIRWRDQLKQVVAFMEELIDTALSKGIDEHWEEFSDAFNAFLTELGEEVEFGTINGVRVTLNRADKLHLIGYLKLLVLGVPQLLLGLLQTILDLLKLPGAKDKLEDLEKIWDRLRDHLSDATKIPGTLLLTGFAKMLVVPVLLAVGVNPYLVGMIGVGLVVYSYVAWPSKEKFTIYCCRSQTAYGH